MQGRGGVDQRRIPDPAKQIESGQPTLPGERTDAECLVAGVELDHRPHDQPVDMVDMTAESEISIALFGPAGRGPFARHLGSNRAIPDGGQSEISRSLVDVE